jgi:hypothetical protein
MLNVKRVLSQLMFIVMEDVYTLGCYEPYYLLSTEYESRMAVFSFGPTYHSTGEDL